MNGERVDSAFPTTHSYGMSMRDYFAAHAPEPPKIWRGGERSIVDIVQWHWAYADAMLKARESK